MDRYLKILDSTRADIPDNLQKYWIENTDFEYCNFSDNNYCFRENNNLSRLKKLYELNKNNVPYIDNNIKRGCRRFMAGLFSSKIFPINSLYIAKYFTKFKKTYIETQFNNLNVRDKFAYGIDEIIMSKIFKNYSDGVLTGLDYFFVPKLLR
jgi:hypothetical protein